VKDYRDAAVQALHIFGSGQAIARKMKPFADKLSDADVGALSPMFVP
jgi:hypothetical protein